ncbi:LacZ Beta-galactosidase/beta-glucuronidase [Candidatus Nanopelagicaceae bacterium]
MLPNYWMSPETNSINRLGMLHIEHFETLSLDGTWRFQLLHSPTENVRKRWSKIPVPGLWTMQPTSDVFFDKPIYTNVQMPWDHVAPEVPEENPTGIYERDFDLPLSWDNKRVVLHLGGFESVAVITVNGVEVGMTKDSRLAAEFDITSVVKRDRNVMRIAVTKWSDATYIEDQDQWWHGGITRSVKLYATEHVFIEKFATTAGLKADGTTGTLKIDAIIGSINGKPTDGYTLRTSIEELPKVKSAQLSQTLKKHVAPIWTEMTREMINANRKHFAGEYWDGSMPESDRLALEAIKQPWPGHIVLETTIPKVAAWSAETPNLYTLRIELVSPTGTVVEVSQQRIGFRSVVVKGRELLVNGKLIYIYGVNRHDFNRHTGRVLSREDMRQDLLEMKRWNFNAVRTSHYPNDPAFYDLCDELGFYVIDEANIESHAFYDSISNDPRYASAFVERVGRMVQRDMHHPCVIFWSLGNESGRGKNHGAAAAFARALDPSRPLHYEGGINGDWRGGHSLTDVVSPMYPSIKAILSYAKSGRQDRPLIMCEYSHAMGNSNGTLKEYWDAIHSTPGLQGGFIWEFWDHGIEQTMADGSKRSAYGGDFGENRHDGNFVCDGMVFPDRTPKPAMSEMKAIASPVVISSTKASTGSFTVTNRQYFKDLADFEAFWSINRNGEVIDSGKVVLPKIAPQKSAKISIKSKALLKPDAAGERFINFTIVQKNRTDWAPAGHEVGWNQFALPSRKETIGAAKTSELFEVAVDDAGEIQIPFGVIAPELSLWRAPTDNDRIAHIATKWERYGVRELERTDCTITETSKSYKVTSEWKTSTGFKIKQVQLVTPVADGFSVKETITVPKQLEDLARVGVNFEIDGALSNYTYFGIGSNETYPDRKIGRVHKWESTVAEQYVPYVRPQENGGHAGVRWFSLTDASGRGVRIDLDKPRQVSATPLRATQLADATHDVELVPTGNTVIHIDAAHRGVGTASCGPDTLPQYLVSGGTYSFTWTVRSI